MYSASVKFERTGGGSFVGIGGGTANAFSSSNS